MLQPLDGTSKQASLSVDTVTVLEIKAGASAFTERKVITVQPTDGKVYIYFGDEGVVPNAATVAADGFIQTKSKESYEATGSQVVYILAVSGTVDVRFAERA